MIKLNSYLNFSGNTEEAFNFYKSVFGGEFIIFQRFADVNNLPNKDQMSQEDLNKIMHVSLMIGNDVLMATDVMENTGQNLIVGNNVSLSLNPTSREETEHFFKALSEGGKIEMPPQEMMWGALYAGFVDKFGIRWMINYDLTPKS